MAHLRQFFNGQRFRVVLLDESQHSLKLPLQLRITGRAFILHHISILIQKPEKPEQLLLHKKLDPLPPSHFPASLLAASKTRIILILQACQHLLYTPKQRLMPRLPLFNHGNEPVLPLLKRTDILNRTRVRRLISQHIQMKNQTLRNHLLPPERMRRMKRMRGNQQNIPLYHPKGLKIYIIINLPVRDPRHLRLIMPMQGQILIRERHKTPIPLNRHQHIPMRSLFLKIRNSHILPPKPSFLFPPIIISPSSPSQRP